MDILLTHGYFLQEDEAERRVMKPYPTLGILYISAYLKSKGFDVEVYDTTFSSKEDFYRHIEQYVPPVVGIYVNLMTKLNVLEQIRFCKRKNCKVIVGGPDVPEYAEEYVRFGADVAVLGEGERVMEELLLSLSSGASLATIKGIVTRDDNGNIVRTEFRPFLEDLDSLPFPDREAIDMKHYIQIWKTHHGMGSVSLICARGCPYTCTWCSRSVYGETHRRRSVTNVVNEIEHIIDAYNPDMLWFADDVFTIHHKWFHDFYNEMKRRNIRIPFECISRSDRLSDEILQKLSELGAFRIWFGSESGSQRILDAMKRNVDIEQIQITTKLAQRYGIQAGLFVMLGYPGEQLDDIEMTVAHLKRTNPDIFLTTVAYPIRGTPFFHEVETNILPTRWEAETDRMARFSGRHSDRFYWFAHRYIVNEVLHHKLRIDGNRLQRATSFAKARLSRIGMEITQSQHS